jgi:hypothetical protein
MAGSVQAGFTRLRRRIDATAAAEDAALDAAEKPASTGPRSGRPQGVDNASSAVVDSAAESDETA